MLGWEESDDKASYCGVFTLQMPSANPQPWVHSSRLEAYLSQQKWICPSHNWCLFLLRALPFLVWIVSSSSNKVTDHVFVSFSSCLSGGTECVVCNFLPTPLYLTVLGPSFWTLASQDCGPQPFGGLLNVESFFMKRYSSWLSMVDYGWLFLVLFCVS